ncbi:sigma-70 family RNA polymerase sigma factor [Actinocrispum sp. NPDC049592]|uniref:RNA polymerase sigma factor n=1 Tax=Actinocrispum sp. NPDC049592 TaxID=3154835 RepID=UPI00342F5DA2
MTTESESLALLAVTHRSLVFRTCRQILGNDEDAEDATQEVFERATRYLHGRTVEKPSAYLTTAARNTSYEMLKRKLKRLETGPLPEELVPAQASPDEAEERLALIAVNQLAEQMRPFLTSKQYKRLRIRIAEGAGRMSDNDAAEALKIKKASLRATDGKMSETFTEAAVAARLIANPTCEYLAGLAQQEPSPSMLRGIEEHIRGCAPCAERHEKEKHRTRELLCAVPGLLTVPMGGAGKILAVKKGLIAAGVGAAACLTFAVVKPAPYATDLPAAPTPSTVTPTVVAAAPPSMSAAPQGETTSATPKPTTLPSPRSPINTPAASVAASQAPAAQPNPGLTITAGPDAIERTEISPTGCPGPKTSTIRVNVTSPDGVYIVRLGTYTGGKTANSEMRNAGGSTWTGTVGPYQGKKDASGPIRVAVVAMDKAGRIAERYLGTVNLDPCGR